MNKFETCTACDQFIKKAERACPFCGAPHTPSPPSAYAASPRVSRGAWLATAVAPGIVAIGCSGAVVDPGPVEGRPSHGLPRERDAELEDGATEDATAEGDAEILDTSIADAGHDTGWHGCYGSPPPRHERRVG